MQSTPLLAIKCCVYNHEPYLRDCLDGIIMQQTNFSFVAVVHDDASTDNSAAIIREYAGKYPSIIKPIYEVENQYSKPNRALGKLMNDAINATGAKYVAICEGDDYWTDPNKLQKQVDFMELHPECTVSFHRCNILQYEEQKWRADKCDVYLKSADEYVELTIPMYLSVWVTQPCTMIYRAGTYMGEDKPYRFYKDQHRIFHLLDMGKGYILNFNGAVYRENMGGVHGRRPILEQSRLAVSVAKELYENNGKSAVLKNNLVRTLDWAIDCEKRLKYMNRGGVYSFVYQRFMLTKSFKKAIKQLIL